ncbi:MAG: hypothetical protein HKN82_16110 [Akkermansiaceae bacterium]|nr:hypothetical protein [Akkermansiaceae bacterium]NNM29395.1 hypothetical protein [Akkermansiaceae bacterium]
MRTNTICLSVVIAIATAASAVAGGGACRFKADGLPLLSQSPVLADILTSRFSVVEDGRMGPMDAPFDGGRRYTYMEFRASTTSKSGEKFIIRLHFKRAGKEAPAFERAEFLPVKDFPDGK